MNQSIGKQPFGGGCDDNLVVLFASGEEDMAQATAQGGGIEAGKSQVIRWGGLESLKIPISVCLTAFWFR